MKGFRVDESSLPTEVVIDEKIVSQIEGFGYTREYIIRCL
jgi:hypothetical protein